MPVRVLVISLVLLPLAGCSSLLTGDFEQRRSGRSSSLVDYLYPEGQAPTEKDSLTPTLELPLRVGVAFVPSRAVDAPSEAEKLALLETVADAFRERDYVHSIVTIPDLYLQSATGVVGMQQVAAMYGLDVIGLVSYDQVSFAAERDSALLYWTVVGAALVKGNSNEVQTMIDTAVFDVATAELLFRAPGVHRGQRNATLFDSDRDARLLRSEGFVAANLDMIGNLDRELAAFEQRTKAGGRVRVVAANGGAGSAGLWLLAALGVALAFRAARVRPAVGRKS